MMVGGNWSFNIRVVWKDGAHNVQGTWCLTFVLKYDIFKMDLTIQQST